MNSRGFLLFKTKLKILIKFFIKIHKILCKRIFIIIMVIMDSLQIGSHIKTLFIKYLKFFHLQNLLNCFWFRCP